jgi:hypothetical protein
MRVPFCIPVTCTNVQFGISRFTTGSDGATGEVDFDDIRVTAIQGLLFGRRLLVARPPVAEIHGDLWESQQSEEGFHSGFHPPQFVDVDL